MPPPDDPDATATLDGGASLETEDTPLDRLARGNEEVLLASDRYEQRRDLGAGGAGIVREVYDRLLRRTVAVKTLRKGRHFGEPLRRFLQEAQVTGQLEHPNVVPVYDVGVGKQGVFFTMRRVPGLPVHAWLKTEPVPDRAQRILAVLKVCDAVAYAHSRGVVHRDLKPSNVMVGDFGQVFVLDWGIARLADEDFRPPPGGVVTSDEDERDMPLTRHDGVVGTPMYMAPEQARGEPASVLTDVYALGALLYVMATGQRPHDRTDDLLERVRAGRRIPVLERDSSVPNELVAVIDKAMHPDPEQRYGSATALREELERWLAGLPVQARDYGRTELLVKWAGRNRRLLSGIGATATVAAVALAIGAVRYVSDVSEARDDAVNAEQVARLEAARRKVSLAAFQGEQGRYDEARDSISVARQELADLGAPLDRLTLVEAWLDTHSPPPLFPNHVANISSTHATFRTEDQVQVHAMPAFTRLFTFPLAKGQRTQGVDPPIIQDFDNGDVCVAMQEERWCPVTDGAGDVQWRAPFLLVDDHQRSRVFDVRSRTAIIDVEPVLTGVGYDPATDRMRVVGWARTVRRRAAESIEVWEGVGSELRSIFATDRTIEPMLSPTGRWLAWPAQGGTVLYDLDRHEERLLASDTVTGMEWIEPDLLLVGTATGLQWRSVDGDRDELAVAPPFGLDGAAAWGISRRALYARPSVPTHLPVEASGLSVSPDGLLFASYEPSGVVLRVAVDGRAIRTLQTPSPARSVSFSPRGDRLAVGLVDGAVLSWRLDDFATEELGRNEAGRILTVRWTAEGLLATGEGGFVQLDGADISSELSLVWAGDVGDGVVLTGRLVDEPFVQQVVGGEVRSSEELGVGYGVDWQGDRIAVGTHLRGVRIYDGELRRITVLDERGPVVLCVRFSPDGRMLAVGRFDGVLDVYETTSWERIARLRPHEGAILSLEWGEDDVLTILAESVFRLDLRRPEQLRQARVDLNGPDGPERLRTLGRGLAARRGHAVAHAMFQQAAAAGAEAPAREAAEAAWLAGDTPALRTALVRLDTAGARAWLAALR